jgi:hypothetical protein
LNDTCWHLLLQREQAKVKGGDNPILVVLELYLDHLERVYPGRYGRATRAFQSFLDLFPDLQVSELTERHIDNWFAAHPEWESPSTRQTQLSFLCAAFNWASEVRGGERVIPYEHPLRGMDLSQMQNKAYHRRRGSSARVDEQVHIFLMHNVREDFRQVLFALRHSGTRPGHICKVTAAHFHEDPGVWQFEEDVRQEGDTVHKTYDRTHEPVMVPLTAELVELCRHLREKYPTGPLFRKADGEPWTPDAIANRFLFYRNRFKEIGVPIPETCYAYCYRHETASTLITGGETDTMTAAVLGHQGTRTLHKHYNHALARARERVSALRRQVQALPGELAALRGGGVGPEPPAVG